MENNEAPNTTKLDENAAKMYRASQKNYTPRRFDNSLKTTWSYEAKFYTFIILLYIRNCAKFRFNIHNTDEIMLL